VSAWFGIGGRVISLFSIILFGCNCPPLASSVSTSIVKDHTIRMSYHDLVAEVVPCTRVEKRRPPPPEPSGSCYPVIWINDYVASGAVLCIYIPVLELPLNDSRYGLMKGWGRTSTVLGRPAYHLQTSTDLGSEFCSVKWMCT